MNLKIAGVFDEAVPRGTLVLGVPVIGKESSDLHGYDVRETEVAIGVGFIPGRPARPQIYERLKRAGFTVTTVVHPSSIIAEGVALNEGAQVFAGVVLQPGVNIGNNALINTNSSIDHDSVIGAESHVAPGAVICGDVQIGKNVFIGSGSVIIQGIKIGDSAVIGAGSVIVKDVPPFTKVVAGKYLPI
jgi:UDP-perosamine 4-acetyltransferase